MVKEIHKFFFVDIYSGIRRSIENLESVDCVIYSKLLLFAAKVPGDNLLRDKWEFQKQRINPFCSTVLPYSICLFPLRNGLSDPQCVSKPNHFLI